MADKIAIQIAIAEQLEEQRKNDRELLLKNRENEMAMKFA